MFEYHKDENKIVTLTLDMNPKPMNVIDEKFISELETLWTKLEEDQDLNGVIFTSSRKEFVAGADINLFIKSKSDDIEKFINKINAIFRRIETFSKPVVAAMNGMALGGGLEFALACHARFALNDPRIQIGFPEVNLGIIPGAGGTQRVPRMIGLQNSLPFLLEGRRVNPEKALKAGLVDKIFATREELVENSKKYILSEPQFQKKWDEKVFKFPGGPLSALETQQIYSVALTMVTEKTQGNYPAPRKLLSALYEGLPLTFDDGISVETKYFMSLVTSKEAQNIIKTMFFAMNYNSKASFRPKDIPKKDVKKVGILGAGMMGAGISYSSSKSGIEVILKDVTKEGAEKGKDYTKKLLEKQLAKKRTTPEKMQKQLDLIHPTTTLEEFKDVDLVIEAVFEDRKLKAKVTEETESVISETATFGSNTSTLPITGLAEVSKRPENFIGIHFFSPVDKMNLVEIIKGEKTSEEALALSLDYVKKLRKTPIVVNDGRGFFTSRVFTTYVCEGIYLLMDGCPPALIESAAKLSGMPVGPLAVGDEVSLELMGHILQQTENDLGKGTVDPKLLDTVNLFLGKLDRPGKKKKRGFYEYPESGKKFLWPGLKDHFNFEENKFTVEEIQKRLFYIQSLETIKCFADKVLTSARDGDVGSILGWGFPPYTGGICSYIDGIGLKNFQEGCEELKSKWGKRFTTPDYLHGLIKNNQSLFDLS